MGPPLIRRQNVSAAGAARPDRWRLVSSIVVGDRRWERQRRTGAQRRIIAALQTPAGALEPALRAGAPLEFATGEADPQE
jgi:hypothetical protein